VAPLASVALTTMTMGARASVVTSSRAASSADTMAAWMSFISASTAA
jgi:hypothetical protein